MVSKIIPSKLYKVKLFESVETFDYEDGGRKRRDDSDDPLELQINAWVDQTKSLIVGTGPVFFMVREPDPEMEIMVSSTVVERRTIAITYVPPVQQGEQIYGEESQEEGVGLGSAAGKAQPPDATASPGISDGGLAERRRPLRVPELGDKPVAGDAAGAGSDSPSD